MLKAYAFTWGEKNEEASLGMKKKKKTVSHNQVCVRFSFVQNLYLSLRTIVLFDLSLNTKLFMII